MGAGGALPPPSYIVKKCPDVQAQRRFDKQAAKHHGFERLIPGVASMTL